MSQSSLTSDDPTTKSCFSTWIPDVPLKLALVSFSVSFSAMFQYGYASSYINTAQNVFMNYLNESVYVEYQVRLSSSDYSWMWSAIVTCDQLGFVFGTLFIPVLAEKFGRKWCLMMSIIPEVLGTCMASIALPLMQPILLAFGRFVMAIGLGICCNAATLFLHEISPTNTRGFISSFQEFTACISCVLGMVFGLPPVLGSSTRVPYLIAFGMIGIVPRFVLFVCPDTPKHLLIKVGSEILATDAIRFYHGSDADVAVVLKELDKEGEFDDDKYEDDSSKKVSSKLKRMWTDLHVRKAVILGTFIFVLVESTGISPIYAYSTLILQSSGLSLELSEFGTLLMAICNTLSTLVSILVVDRFGRRKLLLGGCVGIIVCLLSLMTFDILHDSIGLPWAGYGAMISLLMHAVIFSLGPGPVCWFMTSELVPQHMRSSVQAFTQLTNMVANLSISFIFFPLFNSIGSYAFLVLCVVPATGCIAYLYFELPETKNREVTDIVNDLKMQQSKLDQKR